MEDSMTKDYQFCMKADINVRQIWFVTFQMVKYMREHKHLFIENTEMKWVLWEYRVLHGCPVSEMWNHLGTIFHKILKNFSINFEKSLLRELFNYFKTEQFFKVFYHKVTNFKCGSFMTPSREKRGASTFPHSHWNCWNWIVAKLSVFIKAYQECIVVLYQRRSVLGCDSAYCEGFQNSDQIWDIHAYLLSWTKLRSKVIRLRQLKWKTIPYCVDNKLVDCWALWE